eukprot:10508374-Heterocapsa_arctica.AAC.1
MLAGLAVCGAAVGVGLAFGQTACGPAGGGHLGVHGQGGAGRQLSGAPGGRSGWPDWQAALRPPGGGPGQAAGLVACAQAAGRSP